MVSFRPMQEADAETVLAIYRQGIATGHATFESAVPEWHDWDAGHLSTCRIVATEADAVLGWTALSQISKRPVYRGVTEVNIYIANTAQGQGVGRILLAELLEQSEAAEIWTLQAGIFPENEASIRLHESAGFRILGTRRRLGLMSYGPLAGQWRDVVLLERRSEIVGVD